MSNIVKIIVEEQHIFNGQPLKSGIGIREEELSNHYKNLIPNLYQYTYVWISESAMGPILVFLTVFYPNDPFVDVENEGSKNLNIDTY